MAIAALSVPTENNLHKQVAVFLNMACPRNGDVLWFHSANGIALYGSPAQRAMEINKMKSMGFLVGVGDLQFVWPMEDARGNLIGMKVGFIELKRDGKQKLSPAQESFKGWCERLGIYYQVCFSLTNVESTLRAWRVPLKATLRGVA